MLHSSNELEVLAYDLGAHKVLRQAAIAVPKVHGARAADGLAISPDGQMLAYVEGHEPGLVLLLSTKDFSEIRRTTVLPFSADDHQRMFAENPAGLESVEGSLGAWPGTIQRSLQPRVGARAPGERRE
jgi:hypothetical protein